MNVLAVEIFNSIFAVELVKWAKKISDIRFDLLTTDHYPEGVIGNACDQVHVVKMDKAAPIQNHLLASLYRLGVSIFDRSKALGSIHPHDICHIHYLEPLYGLNAKGFKKCARRLIISIYGSDLYRTKIMYRPLQKILLNMADIVTFTNEKTSEDFLKIFGQAYRSKIRVIGFGTMPLEKMKSSASESKVRCRNKLGLPDDNIIVTCGYSGDPIHQHQKILESINGVSLDLPESIFLMLPMTYGAKAEYLTLMNQELVKSNFRYKIFDTFLSDEEIICIRKATDIMINVPVSDQLSGSMQEHVYAGNVIINGAWLPYDILYEKGVFALKADTVNDVGQLLVQAVRDFDGLSAQSRSGRDAVWELSSWESNAPKWVNLYREVGSL